MELIEIKTGMEVLPEPLVETKPAWEADGYFEPLMTIRVDIASLEREITARLPKGAKLATKTAPVSLGAILRVIIQIGNLTCVEDIPFETLKYAAHDVLAISLITDFEKKVMEFRHA